MLCVCELRCSKACKQRHCCAVLFEACWSCGGLHPLQPSIVSATCISETCRHVHSLHPRSVWVSCFDAFVAVCGAVTAVEAAAYRATTVRAGTLCFAGHQTRPCSCIWYSQLCHSFTSLVGCTDCFAGTLICSRRPVRACGCSVLSSWLFQLVHLCSAGLWTFCYALLQLRSGMLCCTGAVLQAACFAAHQLAVHCACCAAASCDDQMQLHVRS